METEKSPAKTERKLGMHKRDGEGFLPCAGTCGRLTRPSYMRQSEAPEGVVVRWKEGYCPACWEAHEHERPMTERERRTADALDAYMEKRRRRLERFERMGGIEKFFPDIPDFGDKEKPNRPWQRHPMRNIPPYQRPPRPNRGIDNPIRPKSLHDKLGEYTVDYAQRDDRWYYTIKQNGVVREESRPYKALSSARKNARLLVAREVNGDPTTVKKRGIGMDKKEGFREGAVRYFPDKEGQWRFSIVGDNGEIMAQSEGYVHLYNAKRGAKRLIEKLQIKEPDE